MAGIKHGRKGDMLVLMLPSRDPAHFCSLCLGHMLPYVTSLGGIVC